MNFKEDITARIERDFSETSTAAFECLRHALLENDDLQTDRIIRSMVFLSQGNLDGLKKIIKAASTDPRDVLLWAEYEKTGEVINGLDQFKKVRDFNQAFEDCEID